MITTSVRLSHFEKMLITEMGRVFFQIVQIFYRFFWGDKLIIFLLIYTMVKFFFEKNEIIFSKSFLFELHQKGELHL